MLTPGSYILLFYYIVVTKEDWTYWISFVASGIQQTILLTLLIAFETYNCMKKRIKKKKKMEENGSENSTNSIPHYDSISNVSTNNENSVQ